MSDNKVAVIQPTEESTVMDTKNYSGEYQDINSLLQIFNQLDSEKSGYLEFAQVEQYLHQVFRRPVKFDMYLTNLVLNKKEMAFDDILVLLTEIDFYEGLVKEVKLDPNCSTRDKCEQQLLYLEMGQLDNRRIDFLDNPKIQEFKALLKQYQKQAEQNNHYMEAKKVEKKIQEITNKQQRRWQHYIETLQKYHMKRLQKDAIGNIQDFNNKWKSQSEEYQKNAFQYLKMLRESQEQSIKDEEQKLKEDMYFKLKLSKKVLELRTKQQNLVKLRKYDLAELIKAQADQIELEERKQIDEQISQNIQHKLKLLKKHHEQQTMAFIRKVQRERNTQILQRQQDQERLQNFTKNQQVDILTKFEREKIHFIQFKKQFSSTKKNSISGNNNTFNESQQKLIIPRIRARSSYTTNRPKPNLE